MVIDARLLSPASAVRQSPTVLLGRLSWHGAGWRGAGEVVEMPTFLGAEGGTAVSGCQQHHPEARVRRRLGRGWWKWGGWDVRGASKQIFEGPRVQGSQGHHGYWFLVTQPKSIPGWYPRGLPQSSKIFFTTLMDYAPWIFPPIPLMIAAAFPCSHLWRLRHSCWMCFKP